jgi:hypothetical protein
MSKHKSSKRRLNAVITWKALPSAAGQIDSKPAHNFKHNVLDKYRETSKGMVYYSAKVNILFVMT